MTDTYYWYDYETTGIDAARDRVVQFAGIRTDLDFNVIAEPDVFYCKLHDEILPHPEACLMTGISPQLTLQKGLIECDFIERIHQQFSTPRTCVVGYNSIRFDDEFTRNLLYRNFFDPYAREWKSGNSRWDLIDVVRLTHALRPEGINWPVGENGFSSFKLEGLTKANGISHDAAHDALSDVYATISLAKLIKQKQAKLYDWAFGLRSKRKAEESLSLQDNKAVVHVSSKYPASLNCLAIVAPIARHPINKNAVIVCNLSLNPRAIIELTADEIYQRLYTASEDLPAGEERLPLKLVHINKSPMIAPLNTLTDQIKLALKIDLSRCEENRQALLNARVEAKLADVFSRNKFEQATDPDLMLYSGGFFSPTDARNMVEIRECPSKQLHSLDLAFNDERLSEMLFRYRCRNYPETLKEEEQKERLLYRQNCLTKDKNDGRLTLINYFELLDELVLKEGWTEKQQNLLESLISYGEDIADSIKE